MGRKRRCGFAGTSPSLQVPVKPRALQQQSQTPSAIRSSVRKLPLLCPLLSFLSLYLDFVVDTQDFTLIHITTFVRLRYCRRPRLCVCCAVHPAAGLGYNAGNLHRQDLHSRSTRGGDGREDDCRRSAGWQGWLRNIGWDGWTSLK